MPIDFLGKRESFNYLQTTIVDWTFELEGSFQSYRAKYYIFET